jgi:hypothetical protein
LQLTGRIWGPVLRKRKIQGPDGNQHDATELSCQNAREHWNEYLLDDGAILRLKPVATEIFRIDDMFDNDGNPVYILKSTNIVTVNAPDNLKRKKD